MGVDYSHAHAACLAAQLPKGARCRVADSPSEEWSTGEWFLWRMEHEINTLRWAFAQYENEPAPERLPYPGKDIRDAMSALRFETGRQAVDEAFGMIGGEDGD